MLGSLPDQVHDGLKAFCSWFATEYAKSRCMNDDKVVADLWAIESRLSASLEQFLTSDRVREAIVEYDIAHTRSFSSKEGALEGQLAPIKALVRDVVSDVTRQTKSLVNQFVERHTTWFEGNVISQVEARLEGCMQTGLSAIYDEYRLKMKALADRSTDRLGSPKGRPHPLQTFRSAADKATKLAKMTDAACQTVEPLSPVSSRQSTPRTPRTPRSPRRWLHRKFSVKPIAACEPGPEAPGTPSSKEASQDRDGDEAPRQDSVDSRLEKAEEQRRADLYDARTKAEIEIRALKTKHNEALQAMQQEGRRQLLHLAALQVENTEYARQVSHLEADKERLGLEVQLYCRLVDRAGGEIARQAADVQEELQVAVAQLEAARADLSGGSLYNASADLSEAPGASDAAMSDVTRTERKRIQSVVGDPGEAPLSCFDAPFAVLQRAMNAETCRREQEQGPGLLEIKDGAIYQLQMEQLTLNEAWAAQKKHLETTYRAEIHALEGQLATAQQQVLKMQQHMRSQPGQKYGGKFKDVLNQLNRRLCVQESRNKALQEQLAGERRAAARLKAVVCRLRHSAELRPWATPSAQSPPDVDLGSGPPSPMNLPSAYESPRGFLAADVCSVDSVEAQPSATGEACTLLWAQDFTDTDDTPLVLPHELAVKSRSPSAATAAAADPRSRRNRSPAPCAASPGAAASDPPGDGALPPAQVSAAALSPAASSASSFWGHAPQPPDLAVGSGRAVPRARRAHATGPGESPTLSALLVSPAYSLLGTDARGARPQGRYHVPRKPG